MWQLGLRREPLVHILHLVQTFHTPLKNSCLSVTLFRMLCYSDALLLSQSWRCLMPSNFLGVADSKLLWLSWFPWTYLRRWTGSVAGFGRPWFVNCVIEDISAPRNCFLIIWCLLNCWQAVQEAVLPLNEAISSQRKEVDEIRSSAEKIAWVNKSTLIHITTVKAITKCIIIFITTIKTITNFSIQS